MVPSPLTPTRKFRKINPQNLTWFSLGLFVQSLTHSEVVGKGTWRVELLVWVWWRRPGGRRDSSSSCPDCGWEGPQNPRRWCSACIEWNNWVWIFIDWSLMEFLEVGEWNGSFVFSWKDKANLHHHFSWFSKMQILRWSANWYVYFLSPVVYTDIGNSF